MTARRVLRALTHTDGATGVEHTIAITLVAVVALGAFELMGASVDTDVRCAASAIDGGTVRCDAGRARAALGRDVGRARAALGRDVALDAAATRGSLARGSSDARPAPAGALAALTSAGASGAAGATDGAAGGAADATDSAAGGPAGAIDGAASGGDSSGPMRSFRSQSSTRSTGDTHTCRDGSGRSRPPPAVAVSLYRARDRDELRTAIRRAHFPPGTPIYIGSNGVSEGDRQLARSIPGGVYAPMMKPGTPQSTAWRGRTAAVRERLGEDGYSGPIPPLKKLRTADARYRWGLEIGRRMRDYLRDHQVEPPSGSWQLNEILPAAGEPGAMGDAFLDYYSGVLQGLYLGRPELDDKPMKGLVHVAGYSQLARKNTSNRAYARFLSVLNQSTHAVVTETFPDFARDPEVVAREQMEGLARLRNDGPDGAAIADKLMVGLTPGFMSERAKGYGGRHPGQSRRAADAWRARFIRELARYDLAGMSEFRWEDGNARAGVMNRVMSQLADGIRALRRSRQRACR